MHPASQVAFVGGGALAAYLMARLSPPKLMSGKHIAISETVETDIAVEEIEEIANVESIATEQDINYDARIIQMITDQSLAYQLENSTEIAKKKALEIGQFGLPCYSNLRFYDSYCSSINYRTSVPNFSGELISKEDLEHNESVDRKNCPPFSEVESVPSKFRSTLSDYKRSGWSRGHLAPAGDYNACQLHKDLTFKLSANVVPQEMSMNGCDWLRLERFVKKLVVSEENDIQKCWIFSGPVFKPTFKSSEGQRCYSKHVMVKKKCEDESDDIVKDTAEMEEVLKVFNAPKNAKDGRLKGKMRYDTIGESKVHVPTHLYKVILAERADNDDDANNGMQKHQLAAFMIPNEAIHDKKALKDYLIDIDELDHLVGMEFFPKLRHQNRGGADHENVAKYGELCLNYKCEYDDDERSSKWRPLGQIKSATTLDELDGIWNECDSKEWEKDWMRRMFKRAHYYRQKDLIRPIQKRINYMRHFE